MALARKSRATPVAYDPSTRSRARAWALLTYLAVFAFVAGVVLFAVRYEPLSAANFASDTAAQSGSRMIVPQYEGGGTFSLGFLLVNNGPLPLDIRAIQMTGPNELLVPVRLETAGRRYAGHLGESDPSLQKFVPFTLSAGDQRWIVIRTSFRNCARFAPRAFETYTRFEVTYTALGLTKHVWVPLPKDVRVDSPPDAACPARA